MPRFHFFMRQREYFSPIMRLNHLDPGRLNLLSGAMKTSFSVIEILIRALSMVWNISWSHTSTNRNFLRQTASNKSFSQCWKHRFADVFPSMWSVLWYVVPIKHRAPCGVSDHERHCEAVLLCPALLPFAHKQRCKVAHFWLHAILIERWWKAANHH